MHKAGQREFGWAVAPTQLALAEQNAVQRRTVSSTLQLEGIRGHSESTPAPKMFPGYKSSPPEHHLMPAIQRKIADRISEMPSRESTKLQDQQARKSSKARGNMQPRIKSFHGKAWKGEVGNCAPVVSIYGWLPVWFWQDRVSVHWSMCMWPKNWPLIVCWYREHSAVSAPTPSYFKFTALQNGPACAKGKKKQRPKTVRRKTGETAAIPEAKLAAEIGA